MPSWRIAVVFGLLLAMPVVVAHGVADGDAAKIEGADGAQVGLFLYQGAKHMVTGTDHLLFLVGVIFFLYRLKDIGLYVSLFTLGHSITLLAGVLGGIRADAYLVDALIGLSIVYKGFDNLGGWKQLFGRQPDTKLAVLLFGLVHGFGLATKLQDFELAKNGLVANIVSFNVGVEIGQFLALALVLTALGFWRRHPSYLKFSDVTNVGLMSAGFVLFGMQMTGYWSQP